MKKKNILYYPYGIRNLIKIKFGIRDHVLFPIVVWK